MMRTTRLAIVGATLIGYRTLGRVGGKSAAFSSCGIRGTRVEAVEAEAAEWSRGMFTLMPTCHTHTHRYAGNHMFWRARTVTSHHSSCATVVETSTLLDIATSIEGDQSSIG